MQNTILYPRRAVYTNRLNRAQYFEEKGGEIKKKKNWNPKLETYNFYMQSILNAQRFSHVSRFPVIRFRRHDHVELFFHLEQFSANAARRLKLNRHERLGRSVRVLCVLQFRGVHNSQQHRQEKSRAEKFVQLRKLQYFKGKSLFHKRTAALIFEFSQSSATAGSVPIRVRLKR